MGFIKEIKDYNYFGRIKKIIFLHLSNLPMPGHRIRPWFCKMAGVKIPDYKSVFIGEDVIFDSIHPENIILEKGVRVTMRSIILTHYIESKLGGHYGKVHIKEGAFICANSIIIKPVTTGAWSVIGAGSVVTKDIPDGEVWAGNPAKFIRKRERHNKNI